MRLPQKTAYLIPNEWMGFPPPPCWNERGNDCLIHFAALFYNVFGGVAKCKAGSLLKSCDDAVKYYRSGYWLGYKVRKDKWYL